MAGEGTQVGAAHPVLAELDSVLPRTPPARALVLAPSPGAAAALRRALTERRGVLFDVDFVTAAGLARQVLMIGGQPCPEDVPDPLEEREALREVLPVTGVGPYARRFAGALTSLLDTVHEIQTLGPLHLRGNPGAAARQVVQVAAAFTERFASRGGRSRWIAAATRMLGGPATPLPGCVVVVGHAERERDVRLLLRLLADRGVAVHHCEAANLRPEVALHSCPHVVAELRRAARRCADAGSRGVPWNAMVVAAPTLPPYTDHLQRAFDDEGVPFHSSAQVPVLRHPRAALCMHVARLLCGGAPRASFLALASSTLLRRPVPPHELARLDESSRRDSLFGTGRETVEFVGRLDRALRERFPERTAVVTRLLRGVVAAADALPGDATHARRSAAVAGFLAEWVRGAREDEPLEGSPERPSEGPPEGPSEEPLEGSPDAPPDGPEYEVRTRVDDCLRAVVFAQPAGATHAAFTAELEDLLRSRTVPVTGSVTGGVQFVTHREALAFPCTHLHLLGLSADLVPGPPPPATFLSDADREALRLWTREEARRAAERELEHLVVHAPELCLSYPRTDARGRAREFTLFRDRIARRVTLPAELRDPGHPEAHARATVATGRAPGDTTIEHLALGGCTDAVVFGALLGNDAARILERVRGLESFDAPSLQRDGDIGRAFGGRVLGQPVTVTGMQRLGWCPQQFLFRHVMAIRSLTPEPDPLSLPRDRIGTLIHHVVEALYEESLGDLREADDPRTLRTRLARRAGELLERELERDRSMLRRRFPGLHGLLQDRWFDGLDRALDADLALMHEDGSRPESVEREIRHVLEVKRPDDAEPVRLELDGKLDRVDRLGDGGSLRIIDFKTGRKPESVVDAKKIFRGTNLQLALYAMLVEAETGAAPAQLEARSVRPTGGTATPPDYRHELESASRLLEGHTGAGVLETVAVLARMIRRGLFPPREDGHCAFCDFRAACRRHHPPSAARVDRCTDGEFADYLALQRKSGKQPLLPPEDA